MARSQMYVFFYYHLIPIIHTINFKSIRHRFKLKEPFNHIPNKLHRSRSYQRWWRTPVFVFMVIMFKLYSPLSIQLLSLIRIAKYNFGSDRIDLIIFHRRIMQSFLRWFRLILKFWSKIFSFTSLVNMNYHRTVVKESNQAEECDL